MVRAMPTVTAIWTVDADLDAEGEGDGDGDDDDDADSGGSQPSDNEDVSGGPRNATNAPDLDTAVYSSRGRCCSGFCSSDLSSDQR